MWVAQLSRPRLLYIHNIPLILLIAPTLHSFVQAPVSSKNCSSKWTCFGWLKSRGRFRGQPLALRCLWCAAVYKGLLSITFIGIKEQRRCRPLLQTPKIFSACIHLRPSEDCWCGTDLFAVFSVSVWEGTLTKNVDHSAFFAEVCEGCQDVGRNPYCTWVEPYGWTWLRTSRWAETRKGTWTVRETEV